MIIVKLQGGLGNQMFQYAAARRLAYVHSTGLELDASWFARAAHMAAARHYELGVFNVDSDFYQPSLVDRIKQRIIPPRRFIERSYCFDPNVLSLPNDIILEGYFQTEKYFIDIREKLLHDFSWEAKPSPKNQQILDKIGKNPNAVALHIRRGDYLTNKKANQILGILSLDYYRAALKRIERVVKKPTIYVFSDDPGWCRQNLKFDFPTEFITHNKKGSDDLRLMVVCRHNVIANSSFSWWGAWLNQNPHKCVIAPKQWSVDGSLDMRDLLPESWQVL